MRRMQSRWQIWLAFAAVYVIWGSTYLAIHFAIETIPPFFMAGGRYLVSGGALYALASARGVARPEPRHWLSAALIGMLLLFGGNGGVVWAIQSVPTGIASIVIATVPLWMVVFHWIAHRDRPHPFVFAGLALAFIGTWYLAEPPDGRGVDPIGFAVLLAAAMSWAFGSVISRHLPTHESPLLTVGMQMVTGGAVLVAAGFVAGEAPRFQPSQISAGSAAAFVYLVVFGSFLGFTAYIWLLRVAPVSRVATYAYVNPLVAVFLGWAFAGETVTWSTLSAGALILCGVVLLQVFGGGTKKTAEAGKTA